MNPRAFSLRDLTRLLYLVSKSFLGHMTAGLVMVGTLLFSLAPVSTHAQTPLTNGLSQAGSISVAGNSNVWSIAVFGGDRVTVQLAKLTGGAGFTPRIELFGPDGESLGSRANSTAARLDIQPSANGIYTLVVSDQAGTGTGTYSVQLAQVPEPFLIPAGDEGGSLTNGLIHAGAITLGDLDMWTLSANDGDRFSVQVAKVTGGAGFTPMIEVFSPDGTRIGSTLGSISSRLDFQANGSGTYSVLVSDANQTGSGTYQLELAQAPENFLVPVGGTGGALADGVDTPGTVAVGDLNQWSFTASPGDRITLTATKVTGGAGFTPKLEIIDPTGAVKGTAVNATAAAVDIAISMAGNYRVVVSDATQVGSGTYQLHLTRGAIAPGLNALVNGTTYLDSIAIAHQTNTYTVTASVGESIVVRIGETVTSTLTPALQLYGPDGSLLSSSADAAVAEVTARATNSGTFKVLAFDASSNRDQTGNYQITMAKTGDPLSISPADEGGAMVNGTNYLGAINTGDMDEWTLSANVGDTILVRVGETVPGSALIPWVRIYGPNGALLSTVSDSGVTEAATRATNSGTFLVVVADGGTHLAGTGNYKINFAKTGSPVSISPTDEGGPLKNGFTTLGAIDTGDLDAWTVNANAGETIVVRAGDTSASTLQPWLRLYGPDGVLLSSGFDSAVTQVSTRATNSGTFLVVISDGSTHEEGTGNYRINLVKTGSPFTIAPSDDGGPAVNGSSYLGTIDTGNMDAWTISAQAGETIVARVGDTSAGTLTPELLLYGPNGALLSSSFDSLATEVTARATNSGVFVVVVADGSTHLAGTGNYSLTIVKTAGPWVISPSDEGGPLVNGSSYLGTIDIGDLDAWTVSANAGDTIIVRAGETVAASTLVPWLRIYSPSGVLLSSGFDAASTEVSVRAPTNGTYLVIASDGSTHLSGIGNYRISLAKTGDPLTISPNDEGGPLTNGSTYLASIDVGDIDAWTVNAKAGEAIVIRAGELTSGSTLTPWLRLYGPDGAQLDSAFDAASTEVSFKTTNSGAFLVVVGDGSTHLDGSGNYRLSLAKTGEPLMISPGDEGGPMTGASAYDGMIDVGDIDAWMFNAFAGDRISISVTESVSGSALTPWLRLYGRDGTLLQNLSGLTVAQFTNYLAPTNGTYMVVVGDGSTHLDGSGTYHMTVNNLLGRMQLRDLQLSGTNLNVLGVGGTGAGSYTLLTTTNVTLPINSWTTVPGQFDQYGVLSFTNLYNPAESKRYFYLKTP
jgi:predicted regulator of Ras-like GTPase activity (Roadblock/LC7/MglB family)